MLIGGSVGFAVGGLNWCARQLEARPALKSPRNRYFKITAISQDEYRSSSLNHEDV